MIKVDIRVKSKRNFPYREVTMKKKRRIVAQIFIKGSKCIVVNDVLSHCEMLTSYAFRILRIFLPIQLILNAPACTYHKLDATN